MKTAIALLTIIVVVLAIRVVALQQSYGELSSSIADLTKASALNSDAIDSLSAASMMNSEAIQTLAQVAR